MVAKTLVRGLILGLCVVAQLPATGATLAALVASAASLSVQDMADRVLARGVSPESLESQISQLYVEGTDPGDVTEALLIAGYDVYSVVKGMVMAGGRDAVMPVASRAISVEGESARYLVDAGVLAAAAEIQTRMSAPRPTAAPREGPSIEEQELERERIERMLRKGLLDDEFRDYVKEKRREAAAVAGPTYTALDLFSLCLIGCGLTTPPGGGGGRASLQ